MATAARIIGLMTSSSTKKLHPEKSRLSAWCQATRMSAVVGDVGQIGSLFAGLAAIVTLFLLGASASRMRAFVRVLPAHRSSHPSSRAATSQQVNDENHECDPQQQMNQTSGYVKTIPKSQKIRRTATIPQASRIVIPSEEI